MHAGGKDEGENVIRSLGHNALVELLNNNNNEMEKETEKEINEEMYKEGEKMKEIDLFETLLSYAFYAMQIA
ncbi:hypothetical protein POVWA2_029310 [Plasmodium ovale wallikeri]|uniref:Uncharacterized protein n=1 Tax=Plasmodium ovale wallikeri TaxID=864142 RepID=A0A1A8YXG8_PLAOA|nr:hypothetical protein POVWA2_029310 [Plasmodium ovale wallikeri]